MKTKIAMALMAAAALTACNKDESPETSKYITVSASVGDLVARVTSSAFEANDKISVYAWTGSNAAVSTPLVVDNSVNTYNGATWAAEPQMLWKDITTAHFFIGVYPAKAITDFAADSYTASTDVLVATVLGDGRTAAGGIVPMMFNHVMSKLTVNLTFRSQWPTTPTVASVVAKDAKAAATVNYLTKTATATGAAADVALTATTANTAYTTILPPQSVTTIVITIGSDTFTYTHPSDIALLAGKIQTVNLIVGRNGVDLGSVSINDWTAGEIIDGGEAL